MSMLRSSRSPTQYHPVAWRRDFGPVGVHPEKGHHPGLPTRMVRLFGPCPFGYACVKAWTVNGYGCRVECAGCMQGLGLSLGLRGENCGADGG